MAYNTDLYVEPLADLPGFVLAPVAGVSDEGHGDFQVPLLILQQLEGLHGGLQGVRSPG